MSTGYLKKFYWPPSYQLPQRIFAFNDSTLKRSLPSLDNCSAAASKGESLKEPDIVGSILSDRPLHRSREKRLRRKLSIVNLKKRPRGSYVMVPKGGVEPPNPKVAGFESAASTSSAISAFEFGAPREARTPITNGRSVLSALCLPISPSGQRVDWLRVQDSNLGQHD